MKAYTLLNAGVNDFHKRAVLYLKSDRDRYIAIRQNLHGNNIYYAYYSCASSYRTLKHAIMHIAREELGQLPHTRWKWEHMFY